MDKRKIVLEPGKILNEKLIERDIQTQECARTSGEKAQRDPITERFDLLDPNFLRFMALIGGYGARKYGEGNWKISRLEGNKSPLNHIFKHWIAYNNAEPYDHPDIGTERYIHLAAIAFNAMMEFYHEFNDNFEE